GLYFSQTKQATTEGEATLLLELAFNDVRAEFSKEGRNIVSVRGDLVRDSDPLYFFSFFSGTAMFFKNSQDMKPWRRVSVELTEDGYLTYWENQLIEELSWNKANAIAKEQLDDHILVFRRDELKTVNPAFGPLQRLGLFVNEGGADFRNVILEPLPAKEP